MFQSKTTERIFTKFYIFSLICEHPVCYYDIIGILFTLNTRFYFQVFILAVATCFGVSAPSSGHTYKMSANNYRTK
jgi:hypothetical protein